MYHPLLQILIMSFEDFRILRSGYDTIEIAYRCALPNAFLEHLSEIKPLAEASLKAHPTEYKGLPFLVEPHGARGGYAYVIDTGRFGAVWTIRARTAKGDDFRARAKIRAYGLATKGLIAAKAELDGFLASIGAQFDPMAAHIGRADYAVDAYAPNFQPISEHFLAPANTVKDGHLQRTNIGDKTTYLRIGKLPNKQVRIYQKGRKVIIDKDLIWLDILSQCIEEKSLAVSRDVVLQNLWRFEFRAGGNFLKKLIGLKRWERFLTAQKEINLEIIRSISLRNPSEDVNRSRWSIDQRWKTIQLHIKVHQTTEAPVEISRGVLEHLRAEHEEGLRRQSEGCLLTLTGSQGLCADEVPKFLERESLFAADSLTNRPNLDAELQSRLRRTKIMYGS